MPLLKLGIPKENVYKQFVAKNQFYEHGDFTGAEKKIFINEIERITLYSQLTRANTNIAQYKDEERTYREISVFFVELRKKEGADRIAGLIMRAIPYPMILIGEYEEQYIFYGAHNRDNRVDDTKVVLEKIYSTGFIEKNSVFTDQINYKQFSKVDFYKFYSDYIDKLINFNLEKRNISEQENQAEVLNEIEQLESEIMLLRNKMKKEKQFNRKMDLNIKIKQLEKQLKQMEG